MPVQFLNGPPAPYDGGIIPTPRSQQLVGPPLTVTFTALAMTSNSGLESWMPFDVGDISYTIDAAGTYWTAAIAGGATMVMRHALFTDDGTLNYPGTCVADLGTATPSATGNLLITGLTGITLTRRTRYWLVAKWTAGTNPTAGSLQTLNSSLPLPGGTPLNNNYRGYTRTGQTAGAYTAAAAAPTGMTASTTNVVACQIRRT